MTFTDVLRKYGSKPVPKGNFISSHSDIVAEIDPARRELTTISGNVSTDTVGKKTWKTDANGILVKGPSLICVIECRL